MNKAFKRMIKSQKKLLSKKNKIKINRYNGLFDRYTNPVLTKDHVPYEWRFNLNLEENPYLIETLGINAVFNSGAIYFDDHFYLIARVEGYDRKSIFCLAKSKSGVDQFEFIEPILFDRMNDETNLYDMRLTKHEDGYIYGVFCSESQDTSSEDLTKAIAHAGIIRTKDLKSWDRLPNLETKSPQQRNVILHPEYLDGQYLFYTRPQDGFIEVGQAGGISAGLCKDITKAVIKEEITIDHRIYHTISEYKNGGGIVPIKSDLGWLHIAHGVRKTAAGLRYVLYAFACDLNNPIKIIAKPSGCLMAPEDDERVGDVSNVLFANGAIEKDNLIYLYYASSDTRLHVATLKKEVLMDYIFNNPKEMFNTYDSTKQRISLIKKNMEKKI